MDKSDMGTPAKSADNSSKKLHIGCVQLPTDLFLHPAFYDDPDLLRRARILTATIYFLASTSVLVIAILLIAPVPAISRFIGIPIELVLAASMMMLLLKLKRDAAYALCSQITVGVMLVIVAFAMFATGGISASPISQLLVAPPLMAYFFGGIRGGNSCALIVGFLIAATLLLEKIGIKFLQTIEDKDIATTHSMLLLVGFCLVAALAFVYESASSTLRNERDMEHHKVMMLAQTDSLTGLANRRMFDDMLSSYIARQHATQRSQSLALCYLDLNGFKSINDNYGHDVGDQVLRAISIRLRSSLRGADLIGRHGGDEFMLLLDQLEPGPAQEAMAQRFLKIIAEPIETSTGLLCVGGSLGFAFFPQHGTNTETLKKSADTAMYNAKRSGLGWCVFDAEL